jgi:hypothetical protein
MKKSSIKIRYVLLCDDVRTEDNGKHILIGLYTEGIRLPEGKTAFVAPLTFFVVAELPRNKGVPVVTWIEGPAGQRMQESDWGPLRVSDESDTTTAQIVWTISPWRSEGLGKFKLHMTQGGHDSIIHEFEVSN